MEGDSAVPSLRRVDDETIALNFDGVDLGRARSDVFDSAPEEPSPGNFGVVVEGQFAASDGHRITGQRQSDGVLACCPEVDGNRHPAREAVGISRRFSRDRQRVAAHVQARQIKPAAVGHQKRARQRCRGAEEGAVLFRQDTANRPGEIEARPQPVCRPVPVQDQFARRDTAARRIECEIDPQLVHRSRTVDPQRYRRAVGNAEHVRDHTVAGFRQVEIHADVAR